MGRAVSWVIIFVLGLVAPYVVLRWGWVLSAATAFATIVLSALAQELLSSAATAERESIFVGPVQVLKVLMIPLSLFAAGVALGMAATYQPSHLTARGIPVELPYDVRDEYNDDVHLWALSECESGFFAVWGANRYAVAGVVGSDLWGMTGTMEDLDQVVHDPSTFGGAGMENPISFTMRSARGSTCMQGKTIPWGYDDKPDGRARSAVWSSEDSGWVEIVDPISDDRSVVAMEQAHPSGAIHVVSIRYGADNSVGVFCSAVESDRDPNALLSSIGTEVETLPPGAHIEDATIAGSKLYLLTANRIDDRDNFERLSVHVFQGCGEKVDAYDLRGQDGEKAFAEQSRTIAVGPNGRIALSEFRGLGLSEFDAGRHVHRSAIDVKYNPGSKGIYGLHGGGSRGRTFALIWAYRTGEENGKGRENLLLELVWRRAPTRCLRWAEICLPGDQPSTPAKKPGDS